MKATKTNMNIEQLLPNRGYNLFGQVASENNNNGNFYSAAFDQQRWAHCALQNHVKYVYI